MISMSSGFNPARSIATAVFQGDWALGQVWAFIVFPLIGAVVAGALWMVVGPEIVRGEAGAVTST